VMTVNFKAAAAGQLLMVRYINENKPGSTGWISLESATLQGGSTGGTGGGSGGGTGTGGMLSGDPTSAPSNVNLSKLGSSDWIHWGLNSADDVDRKAGSDLIGDLQSVGGAGMPRGTNNMTRYSWTGGAPTASASNTNSGLRIYHLDKGFEFTVPADGTKQTLKVYVGAKNVSGTLKATLSDGSAPAYMMEVTQMSGVTSQVITLDFAAASAGETLTVRYTLTTKTGSTGWISLESATLN